MERRTVLKIITSGILAGPASVAQHHASAAKPQGDPYQLQFLDQDQNALVAQLAELIIPADERSPGAREARVSEFIDLMIANSSEKLKQQWTNGLALVDSEAGKRFSRRFLDCAPGEQDEILAAMAQNERAPDSDLERFFVQLKSMTIDGYYTSAIGIHQELRYKGNRPQAEFPGCTHPGHG
jgi:hypothetical protein